MATNIYRKISELTNLSDSARQDLIPIVDISDQSEASTGTTKHIEIDDLLKDTTISTDLGGLSDATSVNDALVELFLSQTAMDGIKNNTILERYVLAFTANGSDIECTISPTSGTDITLQFDSETYTIATGLDRIAVLFKASTDNTLAPNYIYAYLDSGVAKIASSETIPTIEHILISIVNVPSLVNFTADSVYTSYDLQTLLGDSTYGSLYELLNSEAIKLPIYREGLDVSVTQTANIGSIDDIDLSLTSGVVRKITDRAVATKSVLADGIYIANGARKNEKITNLALLNEDVNGNTVVDTQSINLFVFLALNTVENEVKLFVNLPKGIDVNEYSGKYDADRNTDYSIPVGFESTFVPLCRVALYFSNSIEDITLTIPDTFQDLRRGRNELEGIYQNILPYNVSEWQTILGIETDYVNYAVSNEQELIDAVTSINNAGSAGEIIFTNDIHFTQENTFNLEGISINLSGFVMYADDNIFKIQGQNFKIYNGNIRQDDGTLGYNDIATAQSTLCHLLGSATDITGFTTYLQSGIFEGITFSNYIGTNDLDLTPHILTSKSVGASFSTTFNNCSFVSFTGNEGSGGREPSIDGVPFRYSMNDTTSGTITFNNFDYLYQPSGDYSRSLYIDTTATSEGVIFATDGTINILNTNLETNRDLNPTNGDVKVTDTREVSSFIDIKQTLTDNTNTEFLVSNGTGTLQKISLVDVLSDSASINDFRQLVDKDANLLPLLSQSSGVIWVDSLNGDDTHPTYVQTMTQAIQNAVSGNLIVCLPSTHIEALSFDFDVDSGGLCKDGVSWYLMEGFNCVLTGDYAFRIGDWNALAPQQFTKGFKLYGNGSIEKNDTEIFRLEGDFDAAIDIDIECKELTSTTDILTISGTPDQAEKDINILSIKANNIFGGNIDINNTYNFNSVDITVKDTFFSNTSGIINISQPLDIDVNDNFYINHLNIDVKTLNTNGVCSLSPSFCQSFDVNVHDVVQAGNINISLFADNGTLNVYKTASDITTLLPLATSMDTITSSTVEVNINSSGDVILYQGVNGQSTYNVKVVCDSLSILNTTGVWLDQEADKKVYLDGNCNNIIADNTNVFLKINNVDSIVLDSLYKRVFEISNEINMSPTVFDEIISISGLYSLKLKSIVNFAEGYSSGIGDKYGVVLNDSASIIFDGGELVYKGTYVDFFNIFNSKVNATEDIVLMTSGGAINDNVSILDTGVRPTVISGMGELIEHTEY